MCGRYASSHDDAEIAEEFDIQALPLTRLEPDYNIAPSKPVYAVLERPEKEDRPQERQLRVVTWGLIPSWAQDATIGHRLINARLETVTTKPAFRRAMQRRRAIIPCRGYYEWYKSTGQSGTSGKKQPYFITPTDGSILAMAGLYEIWRDPAKDDTAADRFRWTMTIITTAAEDSLGYLHERMPLIVDQNSYSDWLDPRITQRGDILEILELLRPAAPGLLEARPVSALVSDVANNGPALIEPLSLHE